MDKVVEKFPGRQHQVSELLRLLGSPSDPLPPLLLWGPPSTGKSSVVQATLAALSRPHAYVSLKSTPTPRCLFECILSQLMHHDLSADQDFQPAVRCEKLPQFLENLPEAVDHSSRCQLSSCRSSRAPLEASWGAAEQIRLPQRKLPFDSFHGGRLQSPESNTLENELDGAKGPTGKVRGGGGGEEGGGEEREGRRVTRGMKRRSWGERSVELEVEKEGEGGAEREAGKPGRGEDAIRGREEGGRSELRHQHGSGGVQSSESDGSGSNQQRTKGVDAREETEACVPLLNTNIDEERSRGAGTGSCQADAFSVPVEATGQGVPAPSLQRDLRIAEQLGTGHGLPHREGEVPSHETHPCSLTRRTVYLVLDDVDLFQRFDPSNQILSTLLKLPELCRRSDMKLGVILVGSLDWIMCNPGSIGREPIRIFFQDYLDKDLVRILSRQLQIPLYEAFLKRVVPIFSRIYRRIPELAAAMEPLWEKYYEPVDAGKVDPRRAGADLELFYKIKKLIPSFLMSTLDVAVGTTNLRAQNAAGMSSSRIEACDLPVLSKFVLVASFIASRNPSFSDDTLFEMRNGERNAKRGRRTSAAIQEKKAQEIRDAHSRGPAPFNIDRLMEIVHHIVAADGTGVLQNIADLLQVQTQHEGKNTLWHQEDVLTHVATLVSARFIAQSGDDPTNLGTRYWCRVDKDTAMSVSKTLHFQLEKYLLFG